MFDVRYGYLSSNDIILNSTEADSGNILVFLISSIIIILINPVPNIELNTLCNVILMIITPANIK